MTRTWKRLLGFKEFNQREDLIKFLTQIDSTQDFSNPQSLIFYDDKSIKYWLIASITDIFIVKDDGYAPTLVSRREKSNFDYEIIKQENKPRLYINDAITTLPLSITLSGGVGVFKRNIDRIINNE